MRGLAFLFSWLACASVLASPCPFTTMASTADAASARATYKGLASLKSTFDRDLQLAQRQGAPSDGFRQATDKIGALTEEAKKPAPGTVVFTVKGRDKIREWAKQNTDALPKGPSEKGQTIAVHQGDMGANRDFVTFVMLGTPVLLGGTWLSLHAPQQLKLPAMLLTLFGTLGWGLRASWKALSTPNFNVQSAEGKPSTVRAQLQNAGKSADKPDAVETTGPRVIFGSSYTSPRPPAGQPSWDYVLDNTGDEPQLRVIVRGLPSGAPR